MAVRKAAARRRRVTNHGGNQVVDATLETSSKRLYVELRKIEQFCSDFARIVSMVDPAMSDIMSSRVTL
jgi:hypothetical protein